MKFYFIIFLFIIMFSTNTYGAQQLSIAAENSILQMYNKWVAEQPCEKINNFKRKDIFQGAVELVLICKAFHEGGLPVNIKVIEAPNYTRALKMAEVGDVTMTAETIWLTEINSSAFFISDPVVARGEFEEGFFVKPDDVAIKKVKTLDELRKYRAVSNENWIHDWMALKDMKIDAVSSPTQEQIFKMIYARHADFTMQNFTTAKDLGIEVGGIYLVPIPGIKIAFMESRHFVISKKAPDAEKLYKALQSGLKKMRSNGTIKRALVESGFLNLRVKNWKKLNP